MAYRRPISDKELEEKIERVKRWFPGFDLIGDPIVVTDADANILYVNEATEQAMGYKRSEIVGKNPGDLWGGLMPKDFYEEMWNSVKTARKSWVGRVLNRRKDKSEFWSYLRIFPVVEKYGENAKFFIGLKPDISSFEVELGRKNEELELMNKSMINREVRMAELKNEIKRCQEELIYLKKTSGVKSK